MNTGKLRLSASDIQRDADAGSELFTSDGDERIGEDRICDARSDDLIGACGANVSDSCNSCCFFAGALRGCLACTERHACGTDALTRRKIQRRNSGSRSNVERVDWTDHLSVRIEERLLSRSGGKFYSKRGRVECVTTLQRERVERAPGEKDPDKIRAFIRAAREAEADLISPPLQLGEASIVRSVK